MEESTGDGIDVFGILAERRIQEAIEDGLFDNLPGAGKPLDLSTNPFDGGMGAVNSLLKNNGILPPWLAIEKDIDACKKRAADVLAAWERCADRLQGTPDYAARRSRARADYESAMRDANGLVLKYNMSSPFVHRSPLPMMMKRCLREFDGRYGSEEHE